MSKIEVCSIHTGEIIVTTKNGEVKSSTFKDLGTTPPTGVAEVDEDVAEILLGSIGSPDYFKRSYELDSAPGKDAGHGKNDEAVADAVTLTVETFDATTNFGKLKGLINKCDSAELVMTLIAHETQSKNRDGVLTALTARYDALTK